MSDLTLVQTKGTVRTPGTCCECDHHYTSDGFGSSRRGFRALCEYFDRGYIVEPFNFCENCYQKLKDGDL